MIPVSNYYKNTVGAQTRQFDARLTLNVPSYITNQQYLDDKIVRINVVEEFSTLSDSLPSDQCQITLDNRDGTFNFLSFSNMVQILASKPTMYVELGLNLNTPPQTLTISFSGKISGSTVENGNIHKRKDSSTLPVPSGFTFEPPTSDYNNLRYVDGTYSTESNAINTDYSLSLFSFDIIRALTDSYGSGIWNGKTALSDKITIAQQYISQIVFNWQGYGSSPTGNKASFSLWNANTSSWYRTVNHTNGTVTKLSQTLSQSDLTTSIDANGFINVMAYSDPSNGTVNSIINTDYVEMVITIPALNYDEWIPAGYFFMNNWKIDASMQTVTLIGNDWLTMMANTDFPPASFSNMNALLTQIFNLAGCTNYSIDPVITSAPFNTAKQTTQDMNCRQALQYVGIAAQCGVYQDRSGKMWVKAFSTLANSGSYSVYASSATRLWHNPTTQYNVYSEINDDGGNRRISLANMYELPQVELQNSIYQIKINVYSSGAVNHTNAYTNSALNGGTNGQSFTIDNPLIDTDSIAQSVANYYFAESNYNAVYTCQWRQNPSIQGGDIVIVDDGQAIGGVPQSSNKISRIIKQEFVYEGSLSGTSVALGGA